MKIAAERHPALDDGLGRTPKWFHHVECHCGITLGHDPRNGNVVTCPSCGASEEVTGADAMSAVAQAYTSNDKK